MTHTPTTLNGGETMATIHEWVCAAYAYCRAQADGYRGILETNGIEVFLGEEFRTIRRGRNKGTTIPLLVPDGCQERASELIASFEVANSDWGRDDDDFIDDDDDLDDDEDDDDDDDDDYFEEDDDFDEDDD